MPSFDSAGNIIEDERYVITLTGLTLSTAINTLVSALDISQIRWMSLQIEGTWSTPTPVTFTVSNDNVTYRPLFLRNISNGVYQQSVTATTAGIYEGPVNSRYLTIASSGPIASGNATAVILLYYQAAPVFPPNSVQFLNGAQLIPSNTDQSGAVQQVSLYGKSTVAGDTPLAVTSGGVVKSILQANGAVTIGSVGNDGANNTPIAAGKTTDTVIKASGGRLCSILVTTLGTAAMLVFDNPTAGSGTIIGLVPASSPANGVPLSPRMPASNGITVNGNANNPAVTISWT